MSFKILPQIDSHNWKNYWEHKRWWEWGFKAHKGHAVAFYQLSLTASALLATETNKMLVFIAFYMR